MEITMVIKIYYDRAKDGNLSEFRAKKYLPLRSHIDRLQVLGQLPRGEIRWSVEHKRPEPPRPSVPAVIVPIRPAFPLVVHQAGEKLLDPARIMVR